MKINYVTDFNFDLGELQNLFYLYDDGNLIKIILRFKNKDLVVRITDLDELELFIKDLSDITLETEIKENILLGKKIIWAWELTNQQGYSDAYQFEFSNDNNIIIIQFLALAGNIKIYYLK